ncbi:cbb3-type cytochrome oxidase assembly protein CcoS [Crocinitomix catalasitica]|uniref:cbb3-type cytochrome oxidase assembly protein CcoS n=1 Tax=Crocinitomix catalasitica TaxID=184607 RepID=UPI0004828E10|nr:cbb3-type cytochrome oxidase assembly protein CcoS [Crocinitomix catalasitica]
MQIIFVLIIVSIGIATIFLLSFLWATKSGQYDDTYGPAVRMLFDDEVEQVESKQTKVCK